MAKSEHKIQSDYIAWHRAQAFPGVIFAIPNGGARGTITGALLKAEGVLAGVPDVLYAHAAGGYHGLFLEFKKPGGRLSRAQALCHRGLREEGYRVETVRSGLEARAIVESYLRKAETLEEP